MARSIDLVSPRLSGRKADPPDSGSREERQQSPFCGSLSLSSLLFFLRFSACHHTLEQRLSVCFVSCGSFFVMYLRPAEGQKICCL